jgi:hypothetical protein
MRNTILAAAAAFALVLATAPSFAAGNGQSQGNSSNNYARCADILANQSGHTAGEVDYCRFNF